jgi:hypothetical protein
MFVIFQSVTICISVGIMYTLWAGRSGGQFLIRYKEMSLLERLLYSLFEPIHRTFQWVWGPAPGNRAAGAGR